MAWIGETSVSASVAHLFRGRIWGFGLSSSKTRTSLSADFGSLFEGFFSPLFRRFKTFLMPDLIFPQNDLIPISLILNSSREITRYQ